MKLELILSSDEIRSQIPFLLIWEVWTCNSGTGRFRRLVESYFEKSEMEDIEKLVRQARQWSVVKIPDEVRLSWHTRMLWEKLTELCGLVCRQVR